MEEKVKVRLTHNRENIQTITKLVSNSEEVEWVEKLKNLDLSNLSFFNKIRVYLSKILNLIGFTKQATNVSPIKVIREGDNLIKIIVPVGSKLEE